MTGNIPGNIAGPGNITVQAFQAEALKEQQELKAEQTSSQVALKELEESSTPAGMARQSTKKLDARKPSVLAKLKQKMQGRLAPIENLKQMAEQFNKRNPELTSDTLVNLREELDPDDSKEVILGKLGKYYKDVSLADEALEFLLATTSGPLAAKIQEIRDELIQTRGSEIIAGRNIEVQAREASSSGLGTPTDLRDQYREITSNPPDALTLWQELSGKYSYKDMRKMCDFFLNAAGADLKASETTGLRSHGSSIEPGKLHNLMTEIKNIQAIYGVYRFFKGRMPLVKKLFEQVGAPLPENLNFESMTKAFMNLTSDRYPSQDKVVQAVDQLGQTGTAGKIVEISQFRDAVKEVSIPKIHKTLQHRDELYTVVLDTLEDLEETLDQELEKELEEAGEPPPDLPEFEGYGKIPTK